MLFRQQAVDAQKQKLHGNVSLAQPLSIYTSVFILLAVVVCIVIYISFSHYARKETVRGYLVPDKGLIKTYANRSGNIETLHVADGDVVTEGTPLATIVLRRSMLSGEELSESLIDELKQQLELLVNEQTVNQTMLENESLRLKTAITDNQQALAVLANLEVLLSKRLALQLSHRNSTKNCIKMGFFQPWIIKPSKKN